MTLRESELIVRVAPRFCDAQGMVHASRYSEFLEDAFLHWLDVNGLSYDALRVMGVDLVIGTTTITYRRPGRLGERLLVISRAVRSTSSTLTIEFVIHDPHEVEILEAEITYIAVRDGRSAPLPDKLVIAH